MRITVPLPASLSEEDAAKKFRSLLCKGDDSKGAPRYLPEFGRWQLDSGEEGHFWLSCRGNRITVTCRYRSLATLLHDAVKKFNAAHLH